MPYNSISYVWQVTGCQHTLQPTENDFAPPSIPALTPRGFCRWESLEILLGPEEHVPFMQYAVKNWSLKHPETGETFPPDLPKEVFPAEADAKVDEWHKSCADKLRKEAASKEKEEVPKTGPFPEQTEPKFAYVHVRPNPRPKMPEPAYFERPVSYVHVPGRHGGHPGQRMSAKSPDRYAREGAAEEHARRKSFSDYNMPPHPDPPTYVYGSPHLDPNPKRPDPPRRHSQPRHLSSESSDESPPPRVKRRHPPSPSSPPSVRRFVPPPESKPPSSYRHRPDSRSDDARRPNGQSPLGSLRSKLTEKVSNILPNGIGPERPRNHRHSSYTSDTPRARRSREQAPPSRLSRSYSDLDSEDDSDAETSDAERRRRRRLQEDRERDRYRDRGRQRDIEREREIAREREEERRERYLRRPDVTRRTSSHADIDRRREFAGWDPRNRESLRDERRRWDRHASGDRGESPITGVTGRRYPEPAYG